MLHHLHVEPDEEDDFLLELEDIDDTINFFIFLNDNWSAATTNFSSTM